jgi:hypothetical protein
MNCAVSGLHPRSRSSSLATPSAMPSVMIQHQLQMKLIGAWRGLAPIISAVMTPIGARSAAHGWQQTKHWRFVSMSPLAVPTASARNLATFHAMTGSGSHSASNIRRVDTMMRLPAGGHAWAAEGRPDDCPIAQAAGCRRLMRWSPAKVVGLRERMLKTAAWREANRERWRLFERA